jgi:AcrR family transcriptional regulator
MVSTLGVSRLRRAEQVERNREVVIAAARRVFLAKGYAGATLEEIADDAGFSKGVVYSQFDSKADLFMTLLERRIAERAVQNARIVEKLGCRQAIRALVRATDRDQVEDPGWQALLVEFRIVAARDPALNRRYAAAHGKTLAHLGDLLERIHARYGIEPAFPLRTMAEIIIAVGVGVSLERAANASALPTRHVETMLASALGLGGER